MPKRSLPKRKQPSDNQSVVDQPQIKLQGNLPPPQQPAQQPPNAPADLGPPPAPVYESEPPPLQPALKPAVDQLVSQGGEKAPIAIPSATDISGINAFIKACEQYIRDNKSIDQNQVKTALKDSLAQVHKKMMPKQLKEDILISNGRTRFESYVQSLRQKQYLTNEEASEFIPKDIPPAK